MLKKLDSNILSALSGFIAGAMAVGWATGCAASSRREVTEALFSETKKDIVITPDSTMIDGRWVRQDKVDTAYTVYHSALRETHVLK